MSLAVANIAAIIGRLGLDNVLVRLVAAYSDIRQWPLVAGVYYKGLALVLIASSVIATALAWLSPWLAEFAFAQPALTEPLMLMGVGVLGIALYTLYAELLKGLRYAVLSQLLEGAIAPGTALVVLLLLGQSGVVTVTFVYVAASFLAAGCGLVSWRRITASHFMRTERVNTRWLLAGALPLLWAALMINVVGWAGTIILGLFRSPEEVGVFSMAVRTSLVVSLILMSVNSVVGPQYAAYYHQGDIAAIDRLANRATLGAIFFASPIVAVFVLWPEPVMALFGPEFRVGGVLLSILAVGQFVNVATGSVGFILMMSQHEKEMRNAVLTSGLLNIILNVLLVSFAGAVGAAVATALSVITQNILLVYFVRKRLGIFSTPILGLLSRYWPGH